MSIPTTPPVKGIWGSLDQGDLLGGLWVSFLRAWMRRELFPARTWSTINLIRSLAPGNETIYVSSEVPTAGKPATKAATWKADNYMARLWQVRLPKP